MQLLQTKKAEVASKEPEPFVGWDWLARLAKTKKSLGMLRRSQKLASAKFPE
jgi:hypothetical protein